MNLPALAISQHGSRFEARQADEGDLGFIYNSWCTSYRKHATGRAVKKQDTTLRLDKEEFALRKVAVIEPLVARAGVLIAHEVHNPDNIIGWVCAQERQGQQVLHYIYIKGPLRGYGVGTRLLQLALPGVPERPLYATHWTPALRHFAERWNIKHCDPFLVATCL